MKYREIDRCCYFVIQNWTCVRARPDCLQNSLQASWYAMSKNSVNLVTMIYIAIEGH